MSQALVGDWLLANDADRNPVVSGLIGNEQLMCQAI
jgi:hypothetical protein